MGTRYRGAPAEVRALDASIKLMRAATSIGTRLEKRLLSLGLTEPQFGVLEALYHLGPLFQRDLARKLLKTGGNITLRCGGREAERTEASSKSISLRTAER